MRAERGCSSTAGCSSACLGSRGSHGACEPPPLINWLVPSQKVVNNLSAPTLGAKKMQVLTGAAKYLKLLEKPSIATSFDSISKMMSSFYRLEPLYPGRGFIHFSLSRVRKACSLPPCFGTGYQGNSNLWTSLWIAAFKLLARRSVEKAASLKQHRRCPASLRMVPRHLEHPDLHLQTILTQLVAYVVTLRAASPT